jgi:hypothetical protein
MKHTGDLTDPRIAALYADVPRGDLDKFQAFCAACPYKQVMIGDAEWPYTVNSDGAETFWSPGASLSWNGTCHRGAQARRIPGSD